MLLDHPLISQRYFFPRRSALPGSEFVRSGDCELACYRAGRDPKRLTLIYFHGNGEVVGDYLPHFAEDLNHLGVNAFFAEYRGYGGSTGQPELGSMLDDVEPIFSAAGEVESRVVVMGRSVGSIYAIELARRRPGIAGLVLESGIANVLERLELRVRPEELGATREALASEVAAKLDHRAKLSAFRGRLLVMHARGDDLVDPTHAERNHAWAASADKELVLLPHGDHNSIFAANRDAYLTALGRFLTRCALVDGA